MLLKTRYHNELQPHLQRFPVQNETHGQTDTKPKTLDDLMSELPSTDEIVTIFGKAQMMDDYQAVLISASLMDTALYYLIAAYLIPLGSTHQERIFGDPKGCLSSFSAKIEMAYAMGLIGPETTGVLHCIRKIRNFFAHYTLGASFNIPEVAKECQKIRTPKKYKLNGVDKISPIMTNRNPPKLNFVHLCMDVTVEIHNKLNLKNNYPGRYVDSKIEIY